MIHPDGIFQCYLCQGTEGEFNPDTGNHVMCEENHLLRTALDAIQNPPTPAYEFRYIESQHRVDIKTTGANPVGISLSFVGPASARFLQSVIDRANAGTRHGDSQ